MPKSLSSCGPAAATAVLAAVSGPFSKPQRQVETVKAACQLLEGAGAAKLAAGRGGWQEVRQAVQKALDDTTADNPKLSAALQRLDGLLAEQPSEQGKRGKAAGGKGGSAKKQKA